MTDDSPPPAGPDTVPAMTGFIIGAIVLFAVLFSIVRITDQHYSQKEAAEAAAQHSP